MARRVGRVRRRAFGKGLRKQVAAIFIEALLHRLRVQNIAVQSSIDCVSLARLNQVNESATRLRSMTQVHHPLLVPDHIQGARGYSSEGGRDVGPTERTESVLRLG